MKVSIIGASGKVAKRAIVKFLETNVKENIELVLIAKNKDRVDGFIKDTLTSLTLLKDKSLVIPKIVISDTIEDTQDSDLIVVSTGVWPSKEEKEEFKKIDDTGRLSQSYSNYDLIKEISIEIEASSPKASVLMVTNQSDMMSELARSYIQPHKVFGLGGMIDSARLRRIIDEKGFKRLPYGNHMVGYHNNHMLPLRDSLNINASETDLSEITNITRKLGSNISKLQKDFNFPGLNSGASVLPGLSIYLFIMAYTGQVEEFTESFNIVLNSQQAERYGVSANSALSVPVRVREQEIIVDTKYSVSEEEQLQFQKMQKEFYADYRKLIGFKEKKSKKGFSP